MIHHLDDIHDARPRTLAGKINELVDAVNQLGEVVTKLVEMHADALPPEVTLLPSGWKWE